MRDGIDNLNSSFMMGHLESKAFTTKFISQYSKEEYLAEVENSLKNVLDFLYKTSRFSDHEASLDDKLAIKFDIRCEFRADCECYLSEDDDHELTVSVTLGMLHALNDLTARSLSSGNFMNERVMVDEFQQLPRWGGSDCHAAEPLNPPKHRYLDYSHDISPSGEAQEFYVSLEQKLQELGIISGTLSPSYIGTFYKKIPDDIGRLTLGLLLVEVALFWILMHEEAHYREGHIFYEEDMPVDGLSEDVNKVLEAQADIIATEAVFNRYYNKDNINDFEPSWIQGENGLFRIITGGIALAISILERKFELVQKDPNYPTPKTRFALALKKLMSDAAKRNDENAKQQNQNKLIFISPSEDFRLSCAEWLMGAFNDFYSITEIIANEEQTNIPKGMAIILENIELANYVSATELMLDHPAMRELKDRGYKQLQDSWGMNTEQRFYMDELVQQISNWDELHEIIEAHNQVYANEVSRYQEETLGSLKS